MSEIKNNNRALTYGTYLTLWFALNALTALTVAFSGMDFGNFTLFFMLSAVVVMAYIIVIYFMNIKFESLFFKIFMLVTTVILVAVLSFALLGYNL